MLTPGIPPAFHDGVHLFIPRAPLGQSRVFRVTQLRTDVVHCRESAGSGPVVLKVVPVTSAAFSDFTVDQLMRLSFPTPNIAMIAVGIAVCREVKWACVIHGRDGGVPVRVLSSI